MKSRTVVLIIVMMLASSPALGDRDHSPEAVQDALGRVLIDGEDVAGVEVVDPCDLCLHLSDVELAAHLIDAHPGRERVIIRGRDGSATLFDGVKRLKVR